MSKPTVFRSFNSMSKRQQLAFSEPSLTHQCFKDECDINLMVARATRNGALVNGNARQPTYGDFTDLPDYQTSLNAVIAAQEAFDALPAQLRARFSNDPGQFLSYIETASESDLKSLGLVTDKTLSTGEAKPSASEAKPVDNSDTKLAT